VRVADRKDNKEISVLADTLKVAKQSSEPFLLFGFSATREAYCSEHLDALAEYPMFTIDSLNEALSLEERIARNLGRLASDLRDKAPPRSKGMQAVLAEAPDALADATGIAPERLSQYIESWQSYLAEHSDRLSFASLVKFDAVRELAPFDINKHLCAFINKNYARAAGVASSDNKLIEALLALKDKPDAEVNKALHKAMKKLPDLADILASAFFRRTSKMAMEWAKQEGIPVHFVGGESIRTQLQAMSSLPNGQRRAYKTEHITPSYFPITYSEIRQDQRMGRYVIDVPEPVLTKDLPIDTDGAEGAC
jgi:hypothetical protein